MYVLCCVSVAEQHLNILLQFIIMYYLFIIYSGVKSVNMLEVTPYFY